MLERELLLRAISSVLGRHHEQVAFGYLFGSVARGHPNLLSDIDIAVWLKQNLKEPVRVLLHLARDLQAELESEKVELVWLNQAPLTLRWVVVRDGILVNDQDREARIAFEVATRREFWDSEPRLRVYQAFLRKRLEVGEFGA